MIATTAPPTATWRGVPITLATSPDYPDGRVALWAVLVSFNGSVVKLAAESLEVTDQYSPRDREDDPPDYGLGISGA